MTSEREGLTWQAFGDASLEAQAVDFSAKKVLIADDVADSGKTLELRARLREELRGRGTDGGHL